MKDGRPQIVFRCDANATIGAGHVMRCLAWAQALKESGDVVFAMMEPSAGMKARIAQEGIDTIDIRGAVGARLDAEQLVSIVQQLRADWCIVDGYDFGTTYHSRIRKSGVPLAVIDDNCHLDLYDADLIVNANVYAGPAFYAGATRQSNTTNRPGILAGSDYALLRDEFQSWQSRHIAIPTVARDILVTLGGSDPCGLSARCWMALDQLRADSLDVTLVVEAATLINASCGNTLRMQVNRYGSSVTLVICGLMSSADLAISAAGSTCAELAFMGVPAILIAAADNQLQAAATWQHLEVAEYLGTAAECNVDRIAAAIRDLAEDPTRRKAYSNQGRRLIDGRGRLRLVRRTSETAELEQEGWRRPARSIMRSSLNVLITSASRKVALVQAFQTALQDLGQPGRVVAADASIQSAALALADERSCYRA